MINITSSEAEQLLVIANRVRERQQDQSESIFLYQLSLKISLAIKYWHGIVHSHTGLAHCYKLRFQQTGNSEFLISMEAEAKKAVDFVSKNKKLFVNGDEVKIASETMAQYFVLKKDWSNALIWWQKVLASHTVVDSYQGRLLEHYAEALLLNNRPQAAVATIDRALEVLKQNDDRRESPDNDYRWLVWYTGALIKKLLIYTRLRLPGLDSITSELEELLSDPRLEHRRRQYQQLQLELSSS